MIKGRIMTKLGLMLLPRKCSGGASSENSPGPGKVLKIFGRSFIGAYLGVEGEEG